MSEMYKRCLAGMVEECEELFGELVALCPWMTEADLGYVREAMAWHFELTLGEGEVDWNVWMEAVAVLAERARWCGDLKRHWGFTQWCLWVRAASQGQEYEQPEMPVELAVLP
jgi:hypothetical protein